MLPFTLPSRTTLQASTKKVWAHWMGVQNLKRAHNKVSSIDAWTLYLDDTGQYASWGGYCRNRPLPRDPDVTPPSTFLIDDAMWEMQQMQNAGVDGLILDLFDYSGGVGSNFEYCQKVCQAAVNFGNGFKVILMMDATGGGTSIAQSTVAAGMNNLLSILGSSSYTEGGSVVFSAYTPESRTDAFWTGLKSDLSVSGRTMAFWPIVQDISTQSRFVPYSIGIGTWGTASPGANDADATGAGSPKARIDAAHAAGLKWMHTIRWQDYRTWSAGGDNVYTESNNSELLRAGWRVANERGVDHVQLGTWNDFREHSAYAPSVTQGFNILDLTAYYLTQFKTGAAPTITKDCIYLSHRRHAVAATWSNPAQIYKSNLYPAFGASGYMPARDSVEALAFVKDSVVSSTIEITNGITRTKLATPGGVTPFQVPLTTGQVSSRLLRSGQPVATVTSKYPVVAIPRDQDLQYVLAGSLNDGETLDGGGSTPAPTGSRWVAASSGRWVTGRRTPAGVYADDYADGY